MTKEELLAKIKAEIERLKSNMDDRDPLAPNQKAGYLFAIADILSFLSTLEFEAGRKYEIEQMMKDAVKGEVYKFGEVAYVKERSNAELTKYLSQFNNGDKVKIIVTHETDIR